MSKMRLSSLGVAILAAIAISGCARPLRADDPNVRGIGYVRVDDIVKVHPLYPQLAQLQDSIDALNLRSLGASAIPRTPAQIAKDTRELNRELKAAQDRANQILARKQTDYAQREQAAIRAALAAAGHGTNGNQPLNAMQNVSAQQAQQVTAQANADFQAYQQSVIAAGNTAIKQISDQLNARANRAYAQRATQYQEQESTLGLEVSQQDAAKRLDLRMKLGNLALSDAERKSDQQQLDALNSNEADVVQAQHDRDQQQLSAYRAQLQKQTAAAVAAAVAKIQQQTTGKLQSRRNEVSQQVASQLQGLRPAAIPPNLPAQTRQKLAQIDKLYSTQFQADAQKTILQYQQTKADLDAQYAQLQGADGLATGAAGKELADLQRERDDLYSRIVGQIKHDAAMLAAARGLQVAFVNVLAAPGGIDLTPDVEKDIESVHQ
jgi:hypothetical protein